MSSGFITETEALEARRQRQEEWEKVRTADQPEEAPEEPYDSRPLYQRLEEQKQRKDAEFEETHKLKNMIRGLDDDEIGFLDLVERTKATAARQISLEEQREMREFRERVSTLQDKAERERLAQQISKPSAVKKMPGNNSNNTRSKLQGVIVRKRKISETDQDYGKMNGDASGEKRTNGVTALIQGASQSTRDKGAMKCIGILPGLGSYDDDSSNSECSSDSDDVSRGTSN